MRRSCMHLGEIMDITFTPSTTALVLIDLQHGIVARQLAPHSSQDVLKNCAALAAQLRARGES